MSIKANPDANVIASGGERDGVFWWSLAHSLRPAFLRSAPPGA
jgi:hypothetical protein